MNTLLKGKGKVRRIAPSDTRKSIPKTIATIEDDAISPGKDLYEESNEQGQTGERLEHLSRFPRLNPNPVLETDIDGRVTFYNPATIKTLRNLEVKKEDPALLLPEHMREIISDLIKNNKNQYYVEKQLNNALFGIYMYFLKKHNRVHVYISDITAKKSTDEALKESEERYRTMFENIPLPTMVYDLNTLSIVDINEAAIRHYGYTRNDFLNMTIKDIRPPEDLYLLTKYLSRPDPSQIRGLWRYKKKDGTIVRVEITSRTMQFPDKNYCIDVIDDVTEEKKVKAALRFTQFAVDHAAMGIIWVGRDGQILYVNDAAHQSLGYSREELLAMAIHDINPDHPKEAWEKEWHNLRNLASVTIETVYKRKDDTLLPVELTGNFVVYDGNGYICAIFHDITERKKTEEALKRREGELLVESSRLEETNTALKVLLKHREDDKKELEDKFLSNIKSLVFPYINKLKRATLDVDQISCVDIIETNLNDILSPFLQKMSLKYSNFTPTEIQVANLIKIGKTTKEISDLMCVSTGTIDTHRNNIRNKLGINKEKINLRAYLLSLT